MARAPPDDQRLRPLDPEKLRVDELEFDRNAELDSDSSASDEGNPILRHKFMPNQYNPLLMKFSLVVQDGDYDAAQMEENP